MRSVTAIAKKGKSPATVASPSPGPFDLNQLQVFLGMESLSCYEPQPLKSLSPDVSGTNESRWG